MTTIFLDPDGTHDLGHYVLVAAPTGVRYETQCNGPANTHRGAEGFLVSVGPSAAARAVVAFACAADRWFGQEPIVGWPPQDRTKLASLLSAVWVWERVGGDDEPTPLVLDLERIDDGYEAWIPVLTPFGPGWFLGPNCD